jgi:hypothetical protein
MRAPCNFTSLTISEALDLNREVFPFDLDSGCGKVAGSSEASKRLVARIGI